MKLTRSWQNLMNEGETKSTGNGDSQGRDSSNQRTPIKDEGGLITKKRQFLCVYSLICIARCVCVCVIVIVVDCMYVCSSMYVHMYVDRGGNGTEKNRVFDSNI